jgi:hypothetical protein
MDLDDLAADLSRAERFEQRKAATRWSVADAAEIAKRKVELTRVLRDMVDDQSSVYRPNVIFPLMIFQASNSRDVSSASFISSHA